jgi:hypothetical protein
VDRNAAGNIDKPVYSLASGKDIAQADAEEFVLKNGSPVWGQVTEELTQGREDVPVGELRVQAGDERTGLKHAKSHEGNYKNLGFQNVEEAIDHVFQNATAFLPVGDEKHFMVVEKDGDRISPSAIVAWKPEGQYYTLVSTYPANKKTVRKQKGKSSSLGGAVSQAAAPARSPLVPPSQYPAKEAGGCVTGMTILRKLYHRRRRPSRRRTLPRRRRESIPRVGRADRKPAFE